MAQPDLFAPELPFAIPVRVYVPPENLLRCPRCAQPRPDGTGWIVTLSGPFQGMRCEPCWLKED